MPDLPLPKPTSPNKQNTVSVSPNAPAGSVKPGNQQSGNQPSGAQSGGNQQSGNQQSGNQPGNQSGNQPKKGGDSYKPTDFSNSSGGGQKPNNSKNQPSSGVAPAAPAPAKTPNPAPAPAPTPTTAPAPAPAPAPQPATIAKPPTTITALNSMSAPAKTIPSETPTPQRASSAPIANPAVSTQQPGTPTRLPPNPVTQSQQSSMSSGKSASLPPRPSQVGAPAPGQAISVGAPQTPVNTPASPSASATPVTPGATSTQAVALAKPKKSFLRFLPFIVGALVLIGVIAFAAMQFLGGGNSTALPEQNSADNAGRVTVPGTETTLTYWGLWEPSEVLSTVIEEFEAENPGVTVEYSKQSHRDYRERLQTAIASGNGPDIFRFHATWAPMLADELSPLPATVINQSDFNQNYYPAATKNLVMNGNIVGVPLMYDGLALLYNESMLAAANEQPPTTWSELRTLANKLTIRNGNTVQRAGIAMGTAGNVEHFSDILAVLMLQNGATFTQPNSPETRDALLFYTNFTRADRVWSTSLPASSVAFAREDVAMIFAPSWRIHEIQAQNPNLKFGVVPVPTLTDERITWATFWAEGINAQSQKKDAAQKFLKKLSSAETMQKLYSEQSTIRSFGELYPRQDLSEELLENKLIAPYLEDAPFAQSWYMSSSTHDNGINDQIIKYYEDAVNAINEGDKPEDVLPVVDQGVKQVLRQYGISTAAPR
ncbi:MAG: extracellular solute-binding protein [Microgenomates group bacterium]